MTAMRDEAEPADVVALLRAHVAGDERTIEQLLAMVDTASLLPMTVGFLVGVLENAGIGAEELERQLEEWQTRRLD